MATYEAGHLQVVVQGVAVGAQQCDQEQSPHQNQLRNDCLCSINHPSDV